NLLVVTGLAPTKGIALPLVSSGGTGWVMTAFMLGVLARLDPTAPAAAALPNEPIPEVVP
ncbi:MAG TPA: FtsW/RodA/SpoVE family cell cycle protein, partial [Phycisphaerales bacterium]|nr:FtsW/RodA/SpoVE family cell cycle protein [Phycisphaerales bacterium]